MKRNPTFMERAAPLVFSVVVHLAIVVGSVLLVLGGPIGIVVLIAVALTVARAARLTRQRAFLFMLAESIEQRIPLIPALQAFGAEHRSWGARMRRLATALANGIALPEALRVFPGLVPADGLPLVEAGQQSGRLDEALRRAAEQHDRSSPIWQSLAGKTFYLSIIVAWMAAISVFIAMWIVPKFEAIYHDFDSHLPWLTRQMVGVSGLVYDLWPLVWFAVMTLLFLFIYGSLCYVGLITCDLTGTRWITRRLDTATILDALSISTAAGRPMPETLAAMASRYPKRSIRRRLRLAWFRVADGRDWSESLVASGLLRPADSGVLQSAARVGNLPWAMREMADSNRRRVAYRLSAMLQVVYPLVLCTIGLVVGFYVTACFLPLIGLIERLAR